MAGNISYLAQRTNPATRFQNQPNGGAGSGKTETQLASELSDGLVKLTDAAHAFKTKLALYESLFGKDDFHASLSSCAGKVDQLTRIDDEFADIY